MAIALVQDHGGTGDAGSGFNTFAAPVGASGRLLIAHVFWNNLSDLDHMAGDNSTQWLPVGSRKAGAGALAGWSYQDFYAPTPVAGTQTIGAVATTAVHTAIYFAEYSGFTATPTLAGNTYRNGSSADTATRSSAAVTVTGTAASVAVLGVFPAPGITSIAAPFTDLHAGGFNEWDGCGVGHKIGSTPVTGLSATYTLPSNTDDITGLMVITDGTPVEPAAATDRFDMAAAMVLMVK